jgi:hypothetical protein
MPIICRGDGIPVAIEARFRAYFDGVLSRFKKVFSHTMQVSFSLPIIMDAMEAKPLTCHTLVA